MPTFRWYRSRKDGRLAVGTRSKRGTFTLVVEGGGFLVLDSGELRDGWAGYDRGPVLYTPDPLAFRAGGMP